MAQQIENKGVNTTVAQPTDVETLHTKDVGQLPPAGKKKFDLENFVNTYRQPPLSRFFATVNLSTVTDGPDVKKSEYKPVKNPSFKRAISVGDLVGSLGEDNKNIVTGVNQMNSFDVEVLQSAILVAKMMMIQRFEETLINYSEIDNKFHMVWEGERNNVF
jgi:hypothetical protein